MIYKLQFAKKNDDPLKQDWQEIKHEDLNILIDEIGALNDGGYDWTVLQCFDFFRKRDKTWHKNASAFTVADSRIKRSDLTMSIQSCDAYKEKNIDNSRDEFIKKYDGTIFEVH